MRGRLTSWTPSDNTLMLLSFGVEQPVEGNERHLDSSNLIRDCFGFPRIREQRKALALSSSAFGDPRPKHFTLNRLFLFRIRHHDRHQNLSLRSASNGLNVFLR